MQNTEKKNIMTIEIKMQMISIQIMPQVTVKL